MYFLFKMGIFQPAMLDYRRVYEFWGQKGKKAKLLGLMYIINVLFRDPPFLKAFLRHWGGDIGGGPSLNFPLIFDEHVTGWGFFLVKFVSQFPSCFRKSFCFPGSSWIWWIFFTQRYVGVEVLPVEMVGKK